jgi:hypothetical protein
VGVFPACRMREQGVLREQHHTVPRA